MPRFHDRTLELLGSEGRRQERPVDSLIDWAKQHQIQLPAAYLEWAKLDDGRLLAKYSNCDWFWFDQPKLVVTPDGIRGLRFNSEHQNNFDRIVLLDQGDDPPVLIAWLGQPPWVTNAEHFSDAVFAQVFDWQYWLEFSAESARSEIAYYGDVNLKNSDCLTILRNCYLESVTTRFIVEGDRYTEYRFVNSPSTRLTVTVASDQTTNIRITGQSMDQIKAFEAELRLMLVRAGIGSASEL